MPRPAQRSRSRCEGLVAAEIVGDPIVHERVGRGRRLGVAAPLLDPLAGPAPLPQADQPQAGEAAPGESLQLLVRNLVQPADQTAVALGELVEPDVGGLGHQHDPRHPVAVLAEALVLVLEAAQAGAVDRRRRPRCRMHPHPEGDLFLVQDVEGDDQAVQERGQDEPPARADVPELCGQRVRLGQGGRAEEGDQRQALGPETGLVVEELAQAGDDVLVTGPVAQVGVVEELVEGAEGRVDVGQPQHQQLFEGDLAVGDAVGRAGQVAGRIGPAAVHGQRRKLLHELGEGVIEPIRLDLGHERGQRIRHDVGVDGPPVDLHGVVEDLVDQPHGVELGGVDDSIGMALRVAAVVHPAGEEPCRGEVRDDDVAAGFEERLVELVAVAGRLRDVELECHGCTPRKRPNELAPRSA